MIGRVKGEVIDHDLQWLLVDVAGVGYEVEVPLSTAFELAQAPGPVVLHTHVVVRDDAHLLFGFSSKGDRELFRALIRVSGVGPKLALAVLSHLGSGEFVQAVQVEDAKTLTAIPGVGKRTAGQIILHMKDKLPDMAVAGAPPKARARGAAGADAESALVELGYRPREAARAVARVGEGAENVETIIRQALKQLAQQ